MVREGARKEVKPLVEGCNAASVKGSQGSWETCRTSYEAERERVRVLEAETSSPLSRKEMPGKPRERLKGHEHEQPAGRRGRRREIKEERGDEKKKGKEKRGEERRGEVR